MHSFTTFDNLRTLPISDIRGLRWGSSKDVKACWVPAHAVAVHPAVLGKRSRSLDTGVCQSHDGARQDVKKSGAVFLRAYLHH